MADPQTIPTETRDLARDALEYCLLPMTPARGLNEDSLQVYTHGSGIELFDSKGKTYVDMISAHTRANTLGYGNQEVARAVGEQLATLHYIGTRNNLSEPTVRLATTLARLAPGRLSKTMFLSGGSEAVETAFKLARQYQRSHGSKPHARKIISRWCAYHGATMGALSASDWLDMRHISEPAVPGHSHIPAPTCYRNPFGMEEEAYADFCADYLEQQIQHEGPEYVAAFIAEPIMQANGVQIPPRSYLQRVQEICRRYEVVFIADEVITGFGRTGEWFAIQHFGIEPDIITLAKAMTAGYAPMGAVMTTPEIAGALDIFLHLHTFGGHLGAVAAANACLAIYERENLVAQAKENGAYFLDALKMELETHPIVGQVRGLGMWLAVDFTADKKTKAAFTDDTVAAVVRRMRELGVLVNAIGTAFELAPPLIAPRPALDRTVKVAAQAITEVARTRNLV
ncbi:MAG: aminotransferase class III-fold pyridoxal phosphate-dependent enzyme [Bryobacterales bacterium]